MTDQEIEQVFCEGNNKSRAAALRAVFDAGVASVADRVSHLERGLVNVEDTEPTKADYGHSPGNDSGDMALMSSTLETAAPTRKHAAKKAAKK